MGRVAVSAVLGSVMDGAETGRGGWCRIRKHGGPFASPLDERDRGAWGGLLRVRPTDGV